MIKQNKTTICITSVFILLPVLIGLLLWDRLPEQMPTHWGMDGTVNGWSSRSFAVFGLPLVILALHWICILVTAKDPKNKGQNGKVFALVLWITPLVSLVTNGMVYAAALGEEVSPGLLVNLLMGTMFIIIGNYLPKCRQNYTIGIKIKWTLENEENWNATHRVAGKVWVVGGLLLMACAVAPGSVTVWVMFAVIGLLVAIPFVYSYRYHKKQLREGADG